VSKAKYPLKNYVKAIISIAIVCLIVYLILGHLEKFGNVLIVALGFGAVIMVHEFGHFIVAKLSDIKVEAFSIGFSPVLLGLKRTENGLRIRVLPGLFRQEDAPTDEDGLSFTIGKSCEPGETEYRIGLLPFGGFVKMLGQDDTGKAEQSEDPRSFANKPILIRIGVVAAGVVFNALSAILVFMIVFLIGIRLSPAVIGGIVANSPAEQAGLRCGDRIISIDGETDLDFSNIVLAAAFSEKGRKVSFKVRHEDGSIEEIPVAAEKPPGAKQKMFGIATPISLEIESVEQPQSLLEKTNLLPGDRVYAVNGREVSSGWELEKIVQNTLAPSVLLSAIRTDPVTGEKSRIQADVTLYAMPTNYDFAADYDLAHIGSIVPRLKIAAVPERRPPLIERVLAALGLKTIDPAKYKVPLKPGDIIAAAGEVTAPTKRELQTITNDYADEELPLKILRPAGDERLEELTVTVVPRRRSGSDQALIGIIPVLDLARPVVAATVPLKEGLEPLDIPPGATITSIDTTAVSNFYDIAKVLRENRGKQVNVNYTVNGDATGTAQLDVPADDSLVTAQSTFAEPIPFKELKELYKATGPANGMAAKER